MLSDTCFFLIAVVLEHAGNAVADVIIVGIIIIFFYVGCPLIFCIKSIGSGM